MATGLATPPKKRKKPKTYIPPAGLTLPALLPEPEEVEPKTVWNNGGQAQNQLWDLLQTVWNGAKERTAATPIAGRPGEMFGPITEGQIITERQAQNLGLSDTERQAHNQGVFNRERQAQNQGLIALRNQMRAARLGNPFAGPHIPAGHTLPALEPEPEEVEPNPYLQAIAAGIPMRDVKMKPGGALRPTAGYSQNVSGLDRATAGNYAINSQGLPAPDLWAPGGQAAIAAQAAEQAAADARQQTAVAMQAGQGRAFGTHGNLRPQKIGLVASPGTAQADYTNYMDRALASRDAARAGASGEQVGALHPGASIGPHVQVGADGTIIRSQLPEAAYRRGTATERSGLLPQAQRQQLVQQQSQLNRGLRSEALNPLQAKVAAGLPLTADDQAELANQRLLNLPENVAAQQVQNEGLASSQKERRMTQSIASLSEVVASPDTDPEARAWATGELQRIMQGLQGGGGGLPSNKDPQIATKLADMPEGVADQDKLEVLRQKYPRANTDPGQRQELLNEAFGAGLTLGKMRQYLVERDPTRQSPLRRPFGMGQKRERPQTKKADPVHMVMELLGKYETPEETDERKRKLSWWDEVLDEVLGE